jgi:dihydroxyacetone kinase-like predicted kinase
MGYVIMLEAAAAALRGEVRSFSAGQKKPEAVFSKFETEDIEFGYCTEFIVRRDNEKSPDLLRSFLGAVGDSVVVLEDEEVIKVHVHSNRPGDVVTEALTFGALLSVKIENMREQHSDRLVEENGRKRPGLRPDRRGSGSGGAPQGLRSRGGMRRQGHDKPVQRAWGRQYGFGRANHESGDGGHTDSD